MAEAVTAFGNEIGISLNVDNENYCCISINDDMQLHMKFNDYFDGIVFYAELGEVPEMNQHNTLKYFTCENCAQSNTEGMTFSYDDESKNIGVASLLPANVINLDNLKKILEKFITKATSLKEKMVEFMQGISNPSDKTSPGEPIQPSGPTQGLSPVDQFMRI